MGYCLSHRDEPVLMEVPKPLLGEFGQYHVLESCVLKYHGNNLDAFFVSLMANKRTLTHK